MNRKTQMRVHERSGGQCEGLVEIPDTGAWTRCWRSPVETHHAITKARGGEALDRVGETYHLLDLCPVHHRMSDGADAYIARALIPGYVVWDNLLDRPVYTGSDRYLSETYGEKA